MFEVYKRVAKWNSLRYKQEYNGELTTSLLDEELDELLTAETEVEVLDALCDISYVAMGGLWKLNIELADQTAVSAAVEMLNAYISCGEPSQSRLFAMYMPFISSVADPGEGAELGLWGCIILSQTIAQHLLGLSHGQFQQAMLVVCDSNDTKTVQKTSADTKANKDKGPYYKSPTAALTAILEEGKTSCLSKVH